MLSALTVWLVVIGAVQPMGLATRGEDRGPAPMAEGDPWFDPLDDTSRLYMPGGSLSGIEVSGGDAHLAPGETSGWLATEVITCPPGHRYDTVHVELETPGNSSALVSVLNASADPVEVGFANDSIPGFRMKEVSEDEPYLNVYSINQRFYTDLRIQVNLVAAGADRPRLLSWTLTFIDVEIWRDDFLWAGKMERHYGLNLTQGELEINLSRGGSMTGGDVTFDPFPPVFFPAGGGSTSSPVFYSNTAQNGYDDVDSFDYDGLNHAIFADLDGDTNLDMVCARGGNHDSQILWGDGTTTWTDSGATQLDTHEARS
ncbi:MAG: hypothetical protein GWN18_02620, partial [Thermoplasmata archaeon]|nr:hypothetical protein [Thermoplasmata archaeon]NIW81481.1 hypothetical protein [Thermoplasmata archaeon]NIY02230.1 hypothetical protein [Thermoplasmata archaeon]